MIMWNRLRYTLWAPAYDVIARAAGFEPARRLSIERLRLASGDRVLKPHEILATGRHRFRFVPTPHLPHGWDAGVLFEEADRVMLCSDLMHQLGDVEPVTTGDVVGRYRQAFETYQRSPVLMDYVPYTENTKRQLANLAALQPRMLAAMHGSTFAGDGAAALVASGEVIRQVTGVSETV